jgi:hypothetical protein
MTKLINVFEDKYLVIKLTFDNNVGIKNILFLLYDKFCRFHVCFLHQKKSYKAKFQIN